MQLVVVESEPLAASFDAFSAFYEAALPRVYGYFLHRCGGSVPVAEDLTQETFLAAVAELRRGREVRAPVPWVLGIARHKLLDHYRGERGHDAMTLEQQAIGVAGGVEDGDGRAVAALAAVSSSQRAALVLCYLDGFSAAEIAAALGKSTAAVHSLLERGRASFRRAYEEVPDEHR
jgi:RNA polymerase sigma-70 factor (ECF subfamily)